MWISLAAAFLTAYFLGNLNGAITVSTLLDKEDVRSRGSGNAGMTNYLRSYGLKKTGLVICIDLGKALLSCLVGYLLLKPYDLGLLGGMVAGLGVSLGHDFPVALGFRGGKGILSGLGVAIAMDWRVALIILTVFLIFVAASRYVSLGSVMAALALPISFMLLHRGDVPVILLAWAMGLAALFQHRGNIKRLLSGTERKLSFGKKGEQK